MCFDVVADEGNKTTNKTRKMASLIHNIVSATGVKTPPCPIFMARGSRMIEMNSLARY